MQNINIDYSDISQGARTRVSAIGLGENRNREVTIAPAGPLRSTVLNVTSLQKMDLVDPTIRTRANHPLNSLRSSTGPFPFAMHKNMSIFQSHSL